MNEQIESSVKHCYSTWSESYYDDYYGSNAAYPPVHSTLLRRVLCESQVKNVLDAGCGPASFLRDIFDTSIELFGFDLTPQMVSEGKRIFELANLSPERIWEGSVLDAAAFCAPKDHPTNGFDAAVCSGVLPHIRATSDATVIKNLRDAVKRGGLVVAEARNELFSLFTMNRYTFEFVRDQLIEADRLTASANGDGETLTSSLERFQDQFRMDLPPIRQGKEDEQGYDEVLSRTHNPFVLKKQFAEAGLKDVQVLFYHYHCLPPMFESAFPKFFRQQSLAMEDPHDWRGHFMASAFFVIGRRG